ncbi:hypothetical protein [Amycolatopsis sp. cmx-4-54]|uniref:hypothetical protein n=1 Tax=Amycolatopsis sp. cmx-4-54 TaxID=2790936 RepID=UPI00397C7051
MRRIAALGAALAVTFGLAVPVAEGGQTGCTASVANVSGVSQAEGTSAGYTTLVFTVFAHRRRLRAAGLGRIPDDRGQRLAGRSGVRREGERRLPAACGHADLVRKADAQTVAVKVRADSLVENDEMFSLRLCGEKGVRIGHSVGVAWVADDDNGPDPTAVGDIVFTQPGRPFTGPGWITIDLGPDLAALAGGRCEG